MEKNQVAGMESIIDLIWTSEDATPVGISPTNISHPAGPGGDHGSGGGGTVPGCSCTGSLLTTGNPSCDRP